MLLFGDTKHCKLEARRFLGASSKSRRDLPPMIGRTKIGYSGILLPIIPPIHVYNVYDSKSKYHLIILRKIVLFFFTFRFFLPKLTFLFSHSMDSSTQDGEGFDDANQNLNGYWKLGGPSYKIIFPILFMKLFNEAF